ncbi:threonine ammonia-lyase [Novosphingobium sp. AP12]|uniref:threonine ammonia-lyase n=1 Tax=Novosphingobium sp. AP12 TaxID=1144305 RepID=UPI00027200B5|nr:threonine ammonia-lyase [Novosphingobium sp. AP12]EJL22745.1 threonine dehydratase [Novosphingobium sp. AP12]
MIGLSDVRDAAARILGTIVRTPTIRSEALSRLTKAEVWLKLDTLQVTGAFKERGAANRLALLTSQEREAGVVAMSAGNHAQAVARHASLLGIRAVIVMPAFTPATKVTRTARWGAQVVLHGDTLAEAAAHARALADQEGLVFVHPYDDDAVIAGQGTLALEMIEDIPILETMVVPVGGGGLAAGCAIAALGAARPMDVFGVEVETYAAMAQELAGVPVRVGGSTIAEGIAVRDVGRRPLEILQRHARQILTVSEHAIEDAVALLAEEGKIVAEGAGAAGVAALLAHPALFHGRAIGVPVCGANIDNRALANVLQRVMLRDGRLMRLVFDIPDRPGILGEISSRIGAAGANIIEVSHHRLHTSPNVQAARLEVMLEARDTAHGTAVLSVLDQFYTVERI